MIVLTTHMIFGQICFTYFMWKELKVRPYTARYKRKYTIFRPSDPRLIFYPKPYVTDSQYLPDDHPLTIQDVPTFHLPPVEVHRYDPKIRGPSRDGQPHIGQRLLNNYWYIPGLKKEQDEYKLFMTPKTEEVDAKAAQ